MQMAKLGDYANFIMGQAPASSDCNTDGIGTPFVKAGQFGDSSPIINEWTTNPLKMAEENDVLICVVGATSGKLNRGADCAIGRSVAAIRPCAGANRDYIYYGLHPWIMRLRNSSQGSAIGVITKDMLDSVEMPFPKIEEQSVMVQNLKTLEKIINQRKSELQLLDTLIKARFVELFGDPIKNTQNRQTTEIINVVKMQRGFDLPVQDRQQDGEIPVYGSNGALDHHDVAKVQGGGVITGRSGTIGKVYYTEGDYWPLNTSLFSVDTHGNNVIYLAYLLQMFDLTRFVEGTGVPTLNRNMFHNKQIIDVSKDEQNQFADFVHQVDKSKVAVQKSLDETQQLFDSLMQQYFG